MTVNPAGPRVVLIEEHDDSRDTVALALRYAGFDVRGFASPRAALAAIAREAPDVVVTSIVLPGMRGDDLARLVRAARPGRRPVIVAATGLADAYGYEGEPFDRVFVKPLDVDRLAAELIRLLDDAAGPGGG
jgi:DNA-binding response OmpR family regulator